MNIIRNYVPTDILEHFAEQNNLTMVVTERPNSIGSPLRFFARFEGSDVAGNGVLIGTYGNGSTEQEAIANYAKEISEKTLVIDAWKPNRSEIKVPRLI